MDPHGYSLNYIELQNIFLIIIINYKKLSISTKTKQIKMLVVLVVAFLTLLIAPLFSEESSSTNPIFAGTQLAFYSTNADVGHISLQPFIIARHQNGLYNNHWALNSKWRIDYIELLLVLETGITQFLDISLVLEAAYSKIGNRHSYLYGDTTAYLGLQILRDHKNNWIPDFRLLLGESFPSGKYKNLSLEKQRSDSLGTGAYQTIAVIVLGKTFYISQKHAFNLNINLFYIFSTKTKVKSYNVYGGTFNTEGVVKPGDQFIANLAVEYSLTTNWALGMDIHYVHQNKSLFSGNKGRLPNGNIASIGLPSSEQISLSPCIEYSWNKNFSAAIGPWFTIGGRNSASFLNGVANIFYYF